MVVEYNCMLYGSMKWFENKLLKTRMRRLYICCSKHKISINSIAAPRSYMKHHIMPGSKGRFPSSLLMDSVEVTGAGATVVG